MKRVAAICPVEKKPFAVDSELAQSAPALFLCPVCKRMHRIQRDGRITEIGFDTLDPKN